MGLCVEFKNALLRFFEGERFDLRIDAQERVGIVGKSGSGKTQLLRTILGVQKLQEGIVKVGDFVHPCKNYKAFLRHVSFVPQDVYGSLNPCQKVVDAVIEPMLVHRMVRRFEKRAYALELLNKVGLGEEYLLRTPRQLSLGQCQRVLIARAISTKPDVILADEPFSGLDPVNANNMIELLQLAWRETGCTLIVVSHSLLLISGLCTRIVVLDGGRPVEDGKPLDLLRAPKTDAGSALVQAERWLMAGVL